MGRREAEERRKSGRPLLQIGEKLDLLEREGGTGGILEKEKMVGEKERKEKMERRKDGR